MKVVRLKPSGMGAFLKKPKLYFMLGEKLSQEEQAKLKISLLPFLEPLLKVIAVEVIKVLISFLQEILERRLIEEAGRKQES